MDIKLKMHKTLSYFRHRWQNGNKAVILITSFPLFEQGLYLCTFPGVRKSSRPKRLGKSKVEQSHLMSHNK